MNIDPRGVTLTQWANFTTPLLAPFGISPILITEEAWRPWARSVIQLPGIAQQRPPDPEAFLDWREWAFRFNQAVAL